jgi:hypothetical protein
MIAGQKVHIDADTKDWGRIASDGEVVQVYRNQFVQVHVYSVRAVVTVRKSEVS